MSFFQMVYRLILGPLELLFDVIYSLAMQLINNPGLSIIFLSVAINLLVLPLYRRADALQEEEREQAKKLKPGIDHIKEMFKGDERVMILQTYYRQNNYKPYYALKGTLSLLLEIPFFIAAYNYLSKLQIIQDVSFGPISNLGSPDGLINIFGLTINLLPVLMTLINIVSGAIYTRGMPLKSKIQLYGMALVFLVLLYDSPAGLVFYWTLNNVFSLIKNIFYKMKNPKAVIRWICSGVGIVLVIIFVGIRPVTGIRKTILVLCAAAALQTPWIRLWISKIRRKNVKAKEIISEDKKGYDGKGIFYTSCLFLTILTGILIPSAVIKSSPGEFVDVTHLINPLSYILSSLLISAGTFIIWCVVFYRLSAKSTKSKYSVFFAIVAICAAVNFMFFGKEYGNLSSTLKYDLPITITDKSVFLINTGVLIIIAMAIYFIWSRKKEIVFVICIAATITLSVMSGMNIVSIQDSYNEIKTASEQVTNEQASFPLDKKGKNVVVLMMDRAISGFVPYIFEERPELKKQYTGFVYYPNTISYGGFTNVGAPPLFGGYDYIPDVMDSRLDVLLKDKHNEALKIMPVNFLNNDFTVTVCDPTYANYAWTPDLSIYNSYPDIRKYNTVGAFNENKWETMQKEEHLRNRNFFCYSIMRSSPVVIQQELYNDGDYNEAIAGYAKGTRTLEDLWAPFVEAYLAVRNLPIMTQITDDGNNTFMMLSNTMTHDVQTLQGPAYDPTIYDSNSTYEDEHRIRKSWDGKEMELTTKTQRQHYSSNMAAYILIGEWLDYLRENGIYDNTRIIIVSDHGNDLGLFNMQLVGENCPSWLDTMMYNPVLLVKDFGETGEIKSDQSFMTNADTPYIAFDELVANPQNPFLGTSMSDEAKSNDEQHIIMTYWNTNENNGYTFSDPSRLTLRNGDIFKLENWSY